MMSEWKCGHPGFVATDPVIRGEEDIREISPAQVERAVKAMQKSLCFSCLIAQREKVG